MEALLVREGNNYRYRSTTLTISPSIDQNPKISTMQMDGFFATISFGNQVQEGYK
jgi:hypothetical protein